MEALNKKERNDAYASFLVFFLITAALLLLAVFFAYQVPFKENERLRKQLKKYEHENEFMNAFASKLTSAKSSLDSVNIAGSQAPVIDGSIKEQITAMSTMINADSITNKAIYQTIVQTLLASQTDKSLLRSSSATESNLGAVQQQLTSLQNQLALCEQQKNMLQTNLMMYQNNNR